MADFFYRAQSNLSASVSNTQQALTSHSLRCDFWYIVHEEVHGLPSEHF